MQFTKCFVRAKGRVFSVLTWAVGVRESFLESVSKGRLERGAAVSWGCGRRQWKEVFRQRDHVVHKPPGESTLVGCSLEGRGSTGSRLPGEQASLVFNPGCSLQSGSVRWRYSQAPPTVWLNWLLCGRQDLWTCRILSLPPACQILPNCSFPFLYQAPGWLQLAARVRNRERLGRAW